MKERNNNQQEGVYLPPTWCGAICRNAMNDVCVENCAIKRDCSGFLPKENLDLADMPRFPRTNEMTREEKFTSVTIYLAKVVDHLKGIENEHGTYLVRRQSVRRLSPVLEVVSSLSSELAPATEERKEE